MNFNEDISEQIFLPCWSFVLLSNEGKQKQFFRKENKSFFCTALISFFFQFVRGKMKQQRNSILCGNLENETNEYNRCQLELICKVLFSTCFFNIFCSSGMRKENFQFETKPVANINLCTLFQKQEVGSKNKKVLK